jgi:hypothetical protein
VGLREFRIDCIERQVDHHPGPTIGEADAVG